MQIQSTSLPPELRAACLGVSLAIGFLARFAAAEELAPQQAVEKLAASVALVNNYDVTVTLKRTQTMKLETSMRDGKRYGQRVPWPEGQSPRVDTYLTRQFMENGVNFRTENYNGDTKEPTFTFAMDDKVRMSLEFNPGRYFGSIYKRSPSVDQDLVRVGNAYGTFYAYFIDAIPIAQVLGERKKLRHATDTKFPELYVIECEPEFQEQTLGRLCLRVYLDPLNGYLPARIEQYTQDFERLGSRLEILSYKTLPVGIAVPTQTKVTSFVTTPSSEYLGQTEQVFEYSLDLEKSRWNCELDEGIFTVQFPPGTVVSDNTKPRERPVGPPPPLPAAPAAQDVPN